MKTTKSKAESALFSQNSNKYVKYLEYLSAQDGALQGIAYSPLQTGAQHLSTAAGSKLTTTDHKDQEDLAQVAEKNATVEDWITRSVSIERTDLANASYSPYSTLPNARGRATTVQHSHLNRRPLSCSNVRLFGEVDDAEPLPPRTDTDEDRPASEQKYQRNKREQGPLSHEKSWKDQLHDHTLQAFTTKPLTASDAIYRCHQQSLELNTSSSVATWSTRRTSVSDLEDGFHRMNIGEDKDKDGKYSLLKTLFPKHHSGTGKHNESGSSEQPHSHLGFTEHGRKESQESRKESTGGLLTLHRTVSSSKGLNTPEIDATNAMAALMTQIAALGTHESLNPFADTSPMSPSGAWPMVKNAKLQNVNVDSAKHDVEQSAVRTSDRFEELPDLQVQDLTMPTNPTSIKESGEQYKETTHAVRLAENKADDQVESLDKDISPLVQQNELKTPSMTVDTIENSPLQYYLIWEPIIVSIQRVIAKTLSIFNVIDQPVDQGKTRVQWQCHCGYRSFDDFVELRPGAAKQYEQLLHRTQSNSDQSADYRNDAVSRFLSRFTKAIGEVLQGYKEGRALPLPQHKPVSARQHQPQAPAKTADQQIFLLLCIPYRQYATKLLQLELQDLQSDQHLFNLLRAGYKDIRGRLKSSLSLKTVKSIKFVQFEVYEPELVDVRKANDIPPEDRRDEYLYRPMPADLVPPVGENHMLHLYAHPEDANASTGVCLSRIPKKIRERLRACPVQGTSLGWGIRIIEGWHFNLF